MRRLITFLSGVLIGGAFVYLAMNFHVIRAQDGFHLIPKVNARLSNTYADIRGYQVADWAAHGELAAALVKANRGDLLEGALNDTISKGIDRLMNPQQ